MLLPQLIQMPNAEMLPVFAMVTKVIKKGIAQLDCKADTLQLLFCSD